MTRFAHHLEHRDAWREYPDAATRAKGSPTGLRSIAVCGACASRFEDHSHLAAVREARLSRRADRVRQIVESPQWREFRNGVQALDTGPPRRRARLALYPEEDGVGWRLWRGPADWRADGWKCFGFVADKQDAARTLVLASEGPPF